MEAVRILTLGAKLLQIASRAIVAWLRANDSFSMGQSPQIESGYLRIDCTTPLLSSQRFVHSFNIAVPVERDTSASGLR
jgi:hypothetical protein